jgi:hypothetical protein
MLSIKAQRVEIEDILSDNPGLKPRVGEAIARAYRKARIAAADETGVDEATFPETCGYSLHEIVSRTFTS